MFIFLKKELLKQKNLFYDLILTSETLYNTNCHKRLYTILKEQLNPNGKILIASKTYYFGKAFLCFLISIS